MCQLQLVKINHFMITIDVNCETFVLGFDHLEQSILKLVRKAMVIVTNTNEIAIVKNRTLT